MNEALPDDALPDDVLPDDVLTVRFEEHRAHLRRVAYRMLGSLAEADDAVQETWLRLHRSDTSGVDNLGGWLTTVTARICLNLLRGRTTRREDSLEDRMERLPEPLVSLRANTDPAPGPEDEALLADGVGIALLVVLDRLSPAERLAFVLHDLFAVPFEEIAPVVGRSVEATRQLASRARRRVRGEAPVPEADLSRQRQVVDAFFAAARDGDFERLVGVLDPQVVLVADGGAAQGTLTFRGAQRVAGNALMYAHPDRLVRPALVNGAAGVVITLHDELYSLMTFTVAQGRIAQIHVFTDTGLLSRIGRRL